jgi:GGDEF domain-containing protein
LISRTIQRELTRQQSFTDPLTGIYNRHCLKTWQVDSSVRRSAQKKPFTFMLIDGPLQAGGRRFGLTGDVVLPTQRPCTKHSVRGSEVFRYGRMSSW